MTCVGTRVRLWAYQYDDDYITPFYPLGSEFSDRENYVEYSSSEHQILQLLQFIQDNPTPPDSVFVNPPSPKPANATLPADWHDDEVSRMLGSFHESRRMVVLSNALASGERAATRDELAYGQPPSHVQAYGGPSGYGSQPVSAYASSNRYQQAQPAHPSTYTSSSQAPQQVLSDHPQAPVVDAMQCAYAEVVRVDGRTLTCALQSGSHIYTALERWAASHVGFRIRGHPGRLFSRGRWTLKGRVPTRGSRF